MLDLAHNIMHKMGISPAQKTADATSAIIDLQKYKSVSILAIIGAVTTADASNLFTLKVYTGDASNMSDEAEVTTFTVSKQQDGTAWDRKCNATGEADAMHLVGFNAAGKRYARFKWVETGTADAVLGGAFIVGDALNLPAVDAAA